MYKSPITIIESMIDSIYKDIVKKKDDAIFAEIQSSFGVDVDRQELIRALQYDRNQYEKGYADGKRDAMAELVRCKDCIWARYEEDANAYWCNNPDLDCSCYRPGDGFCESGERREGE